ncbi:50S ribosomal protein L23 [Candidatus Woesearchaeota archaeon]|nr:50S ribosomal protein L23 [Candidatus Woesearchaeota archaeon]
MKSPFEIINYPIATEKSIRLMELENKLIFSIKKDANKSDVKKAIEDLFKVKVVKVNTFIRGCEKRAYVKFHQSTPAIDIATNLGLL